jgi:phage-related protein (TIGR01555 family)
MGGHIIDFGTQVRTQSEIELLKEQNNELKNSNSLRKMELFNGMTGLLQAAQNQFNLTSFNPLFQSNITAPLTQNQSFLNYFYKTHGIIQTAIKQPVLDAMSSGDQTGSGVVITSKTLDEEDIRELQTYMEDNDVWSVITNTGIWARLFGGAAIVINDGAKDYSTPLNPDTPLPFLKLYSASRWELGSPYKIADTNNIVDTNNPWQDKASVESEFYDYYGTKLHRSRVITLVGQEAPWMIRWQLQGWGMSEVERMVEDFNMYLRMNNVIYDLLNEAKVDVFSIDGFRDLMMSDGGNQKILERISTVQKAKNMNNALILDKMDEYSQKQMSFAGLAEMKKEIRMGIASAVNMPISKIFGVGATGFSSGEDDLENYNSMVQSTVRAKLRRPIKQVLNLITRHLWGSAPDDLEISFKPLRVMSAKDEEEIKTKKFARITWMYEKGLMTSHEVGMACHKGNLIDVETAAEKGEIEDFPVDPATLNAPEDPKPEAKAKPSKSKKDK